MSVGDGWNQLLQRNAPIPRSPQAETAVEGTIVDTFEFTATFTLDGNTDHIYGPAPFGRTTTPPLAGDKCLITFVGNGIDKAWIVRWTLPD